MSTSAAHVRRRTLLRATSVTAAAGAAAATLDAPAALAGPRRAASTAQDQLFAELDAKIQAGMTRYAIPGAAVGVRYRGVDYLKGYGVTNVDYPVPVDADTVFRVGSTTKTFTGTTVMRLVEAGKLALDAPVRRYLPGFRTADPSVAARVTVRELLNHTAGWLGDFLQDFGPGDDAGARYVAAIAKLPQLTPPGRVFSYNNAALEVAGRLIEVVTGMTYEAAVRALLIDPLGLAHSRYFTDEIVGFNVAASHNVVNGEPVVEPSFFAVPRSIDAAGALISSARDQLRWAAFHLGDGTVPGGGARLLRPETLRAMRSHPGPGGTLFVELDGVGVTWMLRPSAQGVRIVQHGGDWTGQHSGFLMVPDRDFAITLLTNSEGGPGLVAELFADDWALRRFAGLTNLPATPYPLSAAQLAAYEGGYVLEEILPSGQTVTLEIQLTADNGGLRLALDGTPAARLAFYRPDYVLVQGPNGEPGSTRSNFVRGAGGRVDWLHFGGRLLRHGAAAAPSASGAPAVPHPLRPFLPSGWPWN